VEITSDTSVLIKAGLSLAGEGFLLPRAEHPWHMQCTQSYCVMATLRNEVRLIIPCMELIRFYFGSSSSLLSKLFLPPLNRDKLYSEGKFSKGSGHLKIELAAGIPGASAADVGRIFVDEAAWRTAVHVGASLLKASTAGLPAYPQAFFPFEGESDLVAAGKWLSFGDKPHATFLVYSLRSCSHPFPFKSLRYNLAAKPPTTWLDPSAAENLPHKRHARRTSKTPSGQNIVENDASSKLARQTVSVWNDARFPDLAAKTIWKNRTLSAPSVDTVYTDGAEEISETATGDPGSQKRVRSIDLQVRINAKSASSPPGFLEEIMQELLQLNGFAIDLLTDSEEDGWTIPIALLADEDGVIDGSFFVEIAPDQSRERRVAMFSVAREAEHICLVAIEDSPVHVKLYLTSENSPDELWQTTRCAAADFIARREPKQDSVARLINWIFDSPE